jgi:crotonobetainyl-CoA:carnitine CoA-transferase CaiB-like acyl-CoA transferase
MARGLLSGFRALDLTDEKGFVCGKILASMGVDTIKVEKPGGDPARNLPPFYGQTPDPEKSLYWLVYNTDKRGITLNLETNRGQELFKELVKRSDFVLESFIPGYLDDLGLGYEALSKVNPRIIMTSITPFGKKGPYSRYKGGELIASAMSGVLLSNGYEDRAPVKEALDANYFHANAAAALGTIMAHYHREATGEGQQVDVSAQEVGASRNTNNIIAYQFDRRFLNRSGDCQWLGLRPARWIWRCKDGFLWHNLMGGKIGAPANRALSQWMDDDGMENPLREIRDWEKYDRSAVTAEQRAVREEAMEKFFLTHTKKELDKEGRRRGINATVANSPPDVLEHPQLKARNYWAELNYPKLGAAAPRYGKYFFLSSETENYIRRAAPLIGEHNSEIYEKELGLSDAQLAALKEAEVI